MLAPQLHTYALEIHSSRSLQVKVKDRAVELSLVECSCHQNQQKPIQCGTIVAVGNGKTGVTMNSKVGDRVMYLKQSGAEIEVDGKKYFMMRQDDIFGTFKLNQI